MSELTLTAVRLGLLVLMWAFVFGVVGVIRGDLYGTRIVRRGNGGRATIKPTASAPKPGRRERRGPQHVVVVEGALRGTSIPLRGSGVLLGRNPECSLVLDDDFASGRHARIFHEGNQWWVEDLGSTNGTHVQGQRLTAPVAVREGSRLQIGTTVLELRR